MELIGIFGSGIRITMQFRVGNALNVVDLVQVEDSAVVFIVSITEHLW